MRRLTTAFECCRRPVTRVTHVDYCCKLVIVVTSLITTTTSHNGHDQRNWKQQIIASQHDVERIMNHVLHGDGHHQTYSKLANFGDKFGSRLTGSDALQQAIDYSAAMLRKEGFENVELEPVTVPKWVRGKEWVKMVNPRNHTLPMLGLGLSVGTQQFPNNVLEADAIVVNSFDELNSHANSSVTGKIVVFNQPWKGYGRTAIYRRSGASAAARKGAVGALVRSLTSFSLATPHTGAQSYDSDVAKIPVACITVEDANMLRRMQNRGERIRLRMYMEAKYESNITSYNVVAEITGSQFPESVVIVGGHIDSWDVGTGSMDDGAGIMMGWQVLSNIKHLGLKPKRTLRLVLWTAEELGFIGAAQYFQRHASVKDNISLIMESDYGAFKPKGIKLKGTRYTRSILQEILSMLSAINTTTVLEGTLSDVGPDTTFFVEAGVPGVELYSANENYFHYHHTEADTLNVLDPDDLDLCSVLWTTVAYVVANFDDNLPREEAVGGVSSVSTANFSVPFVITWMSCLLTVFYGTL